MPFAPILDRAEWINVSTTAASDPQKEAAPILVFILKVTSLSLKSNAN
jgi:hypothetical protein